MGVLLHGTQHRYPLLKKQAQADVLRYFKHLVSTLRIGSKMYHVYGHTVIDTSSYVGRYVGTIK